MPIFKKAKRLVSVLLAAMMTLSLVGAASAEETGSLTYNYPLDNVVFSLYKVGEVKDNEFVLTGDYANYAIELNSSSDALTFASAAAETLAGYVLRDNFQPDALTMTSEGQLIFDHLEQGVYLMLGASSYENGVKWTPAAVLVAIYDGVDSEGNSALNVVAGGKYSREELPEKTSITAQKIWDDEGYESKRPESIEVQLLQNGKIYDTRTLSELNNWTFTWEDLDSKADWTVTEAEVPDNYKVSTEVNGKTVVIINTCAKKKNSGTSESSSPSSPGSQTSQSSSSKDTSSSSSKIPQTGQLWWPVGILAVSGIGLVLVGLIRREKNKDK